MPLFIWISGYLHKQRPIREELTKCLPLLEVCLLAQIGFLLLRNGDSFRLYQLVNFGYSPAWYLLNLIIWKLTLNFSLKYMTKSRLLLFSIVIDMCAFLCIVYGGFMSIGRTLLFMPFFVFGYCMKGNFRTYLHKYQNIIITLGIASIVFIFCTASVLQFKIEFHNSNLFALSQFTDIPLYLVFTYRYLISLSAIFISGLILLVIEKSHVLQKFSRWGNSTLFIYYAQTLLFARIGVMNLSLAQSLLISLVGIVLLTYLAKKNLSKYLMNPVYTTIHKQNKQ